ncbi:RbsD/FucU family protein [Jannaschia donghaensis]|uniref:L-fucose mutarotase n=1 Tax=Jannaschia donghaensis TaxID=420998 RepID=A0A0M6YFR9_9RHOB|nr:RbsD/FucU domain-containing protein [Jannaschia donghaensis]CTQ48515.1 L-fucose mutarotase [Jannaschia donghaensis]
MLIGLHPALNADVLHALRAMGHGDTLVLVDTNFPADSTGRRTTYGRSLSMENVDTRDAMDAILSLFPLDSFTDDFAATMAVVGDAATVPQVHLDAKAALEAVGETRRVPAVERFAFYKLSKAAYVIIQTGERRPYGNVMLRKGIVGPDGRAG